MATTNKTPAKKTTAKPRKGPDYGRIIGMLVILLVGIGLLSWLYIAGGQEKPLNCTGGPTSLISFGNCRTE